MGSPASDRPQNPPHGKAGAHSARIRHLWRHDDDDQLIQTGPAKANELFAKLGDTSDTAVKTRERLFTELKEELELLARLEEEHIFPVLRKNKTKGLVPDALNDNKLTRKLLVQLEEMPKDGDEFTDGLAELRRTFQQHVRDEKKELLPAVLKALSDEETQAIVEGIEDTKAEIEEARRAEAEQRRAAATPAWACSTARDPAYATF